MKKGIVILMLFILGGCSQPTDEKLKNVSGYWNIDTVKMADGSDREFPFTNHMDHFTIDGKKGVKNRVSPTYDGKFINYGSPVSFKWESRDDKLFLLFNDGEEKYEQQVIEATDTTMELLHDNGTRYFYKRHKNEE